YPTWRISGRCEGWLCRYAPVANAKRGPRQSPIGRSGSARSIPLRCARGWAKRSTACRREWHSCTKRRSTHFNRSRPAISLAPSGRCYVQAHAWYKQALGLAEQLRDRQPEMEALCNLGRLETARGYLDAGARAFQRSLALAEAEADNAHA